MKFKCWGNVCHRLPGGVTCSEVLSMNAAMASWDDDDDAPPPLSTLEDQVEAVRLKLSGEASTGNTGAPGGLRVASTCIVEATSSGKSGPPVKAPAIKKGFFDSKPSVKQKTAAGQSAGITSLKGNKATINNKGPSIPEFLKLEPDQQEQAYAQAKQKLVDALKPTPDTISKIAKDSSVMAGFDDPDVMAAVNDIAQNPQNARKYKDNKKVQAFYASMAKVMGERLESMAPGTGP